MSESLLLQEIAEQPERLRDLLADGAAEVDAIARTPGSKSIRHIVIAARGSSDNAARYAQYVFGAFNRVTVTLATPSLFTRYNAPPRMECAGGRDLPSGQSPNLVAVVEEGRRQGCPTLAITNAAGSPLSEVADHTLLLRSGPGRNIAATKTYTAQLLALAMLSAAVAGDSRRKDELASVPAHVAAALDVNADAMSAAAAALKDAGHEHRDRARLQLRDGLRNLPEGEGVGVFRRRAGPPRPTSSTAPSRSSTSRFAAIVVNVAGAVRARKWKRFFAR